MLVHSHRCVSVLSRIVCVGRPSLTTFGSFVHLGMFIFGWTSPPTVMPGGGNWVGPCSAGIPFGFGSASHPFFSSYRPLLTRFLVVVLYFSANAYLIDAFPGYVASALAAKIVIRSGLGAATPLFITAMFHNLGNGWAASVWGFISLAMVRLSDPLVYVGEVLTASVLS